MNFSLPADTSHLLKPPRKETDHRNSSMPNKGSSFGHVSIFFCLQFIKSQLGVFWTSICI